MAAKRSKGSRSGLGSLVSRQGLLNTSYLRDGMRDLTAHRGAYAGASKRQVAAIAAGRAKTRNGSTPFAPVRVSVFPERGKRVVSLEDGRHRMIAAREAGAKRIKAVVTEYGPRGARLRSWSGLVRIHPTPSQSRAGGSSG